MYLTPLSGIKGEGMKNLENKLKELQSKGYENIGINQVLLWIAEIKRDNILKRKVRKEDR